MALTAAWNSSGAVAVSGTGGQGVGGVSGTFIANGATPVSVANTSVALTDLIIFSLKVVGGTITVAPIILTITAGVGFTVATAALDSSTYNYLLVK